MKIKLIASLIALVATALTFAYPGSAEAATRSAGTNIVSNGVVYMIASENGQTVKRPYTSAGAFNSYRFNRWNEVQAATMDEQSLPTGTQIPPRDGSIFCSDSGTDRGTCYLITLGKKAAFTSESVLKGLGYTLEWAKSGDSSFLESTQSIYSAKEAHRPGTLVNDNGTVYLVTQSSLMGVPSIATLNSWGYWSTDIVPINSNDLYLTKKETLPTRTGGQLMHGSAKDSVKISIETTTLPAGTVNSSYSATINFKYETNGTKQMLDGYFQGLPSEIKASSDSSSTTTIGMSADSSGRGKLYLKGTPTKTGKYPITLKIYDALGNNFGEMQYNLEVKPAEINFEITNTSMPLGYTDTLYRTQFRVGGTSSKPPITFSMTTDYTDSPATIDSKTGEFSISKLPKKGTWNVEVTAKDSAGLKAVKKYAFDIKPAATNFSISNISMPDGYTDAAYNTQFRIAGTSKPPITFSMTTDYPDSAVTMDRTSGMFSTNKLAKKGTWNVEVTAKDSVGLKSVRKYTFKIIDNTTTTVPALKIDTTSMPNGEAYNKYSLQFSASGGKAPYTWSVYSTTHPGSAVAINSSTGLFSSSTGMYPEEGTWTYDIQVTDALGTKIRKSYTWVVDPIGINPN